MPRCPRGSRAGAGVRLDRRSEARAQPPCRCAAAGSLRAAGRPEFGPEGAGAGAALWGRHNALNTPLPLLCRAAQPVRPAAPLYCAATAPSRSERAEAARPSQPRRFKAARRVPASAIRPRPCRAPWALPGSGPRTLRPGQRSTLELLSSQRRPERRAGRDSPRCSAPGNAAASARPFNIPGGGGRCSGSRKLGVSSRT